MSQIKRQLSDHIATELADQTGGNRSEIHDEVKSLVEDSLDIEYDAPIEHVMTTPTGATSVKPRNLELNLAKALTLAGQSSALTSGDPALIGGAVATLCGTMVTWTKVPLDAKTGFVYWVAYENRHDSWQIPKEEIPPLVQEMCGEVEDSIRFTDGEVQEQLDILQRHNCIKYENIDGVEHVVLRETCRTSWNQ